MKLTEVSTGSSTMAYADYIESLRQNKVDRKIISMFQTVGVSLLKAGATFSQDEDDGAFLTTKYFSVSFNIIEPGFKFSPRMILEYDREGILADCLGTASHMGWGHSVKDFAPIDFVKLVKDLDVAEATLASIRENLRVAP